MVSISDKNALLSAIYIDADAMHARSDGIVARGAGIDTGNDPINRGEGLVDGIGWSIVAGNGRIDLDGDPIGAGEGVIDPGEDAMDG